MSKVTLNNIADITQSSTAQGTINTNFDTVETAFDNTLSRDGTTPNTMSASLDMNSNRIINLPVPIGATEPVRLTELSDFTDTGTINLVPVGGTTGQALVKNSGTNYDVEWGNLTDIPGTITPDHGGTGVANNAASTLTISGSFPTTLTISGSTNITLPTSGTMITTGGDNEFTGTNTFPTVGLDGSSSGTVTIAPQAAAGTYNFNLPTAAGTAGQPLLSGGGGATAQTYGTLGAAAGGTGVANNAASTLTISGNFGTTLTVSGATAVTLPTSGTLATLTNFILPPQGRLTLTSGTAITTADVTGATTLYYTPYVGRYVPIWNGTALINTDIGGELSQTTADSTKSPAAVANNSIYDIFVWNDAGTIRATRGPAWSSDTSRGSGAGTSQIGQAQGIWTNAQDITNGPVATRGTLVGSVRSNGSAQLTDSTLFRWVSNAYNTVMRRMRVVESTNTWTYTTATFRQANNSTANQVDLLQTLDGRLLTARALATYSNTDVANFGIIGIDIDTINTTTVVDNLTSAPTVGAASQLVNVVAMYDGYPGMGRHIVIWKEYSSAGGTGTFYGDGGGLVIQAGLHADINN